MSIADSFKDRTSCPQDGDCEGDTDYNFAALRETAADIRVEDLCDGDARVTLTLPWTSAIEILDLLQRHGLRLPRNA